MIKVKFKIGARVRVNINILNQKNWPGGPLKVCHWQKTFLDAMIVYQYLITNPKFAMKKVN